MAKKVSDAFEEKQIVADILAGDQQAFRNLIEQYQNLVSHIVFRMISHQVDREELCQEIFIKVYRNLASFKFQSKLSTWVGRIAYHACINFLKKKRIPLLDDLAKEYGADHHERNKADFGANSLADHAVTAIPEQERALANHELRAMLEREITNLPAQYRALITLFHVEEMSLKEIAEIMDMPEGTIKNYLFRARRVLKERLMEKYQIEDLLV